MNNFEFISYLPTPTDQFMLGIAKIKAFGKIELRYKHVKTKDGSGTFFACANYTMQDPQTQEKKYIPCFLLDSRSDEEALMDFIRENVNKVIQQYSSRQTQPVQASSIHYPHGMAQNLHIPTQAQEQLPF